MQLYHNIEHEQIINVNTVYQRQELINIIKKRFSTYGYDEINTSTFEAYDLYATMNGTVNHHEMIKTIDNTGQVLVVRPDITIPLTQKIADTYESLQNDLRYCYVLDVFRQGTESRESRESTQAGVEYFGNATEEADAEIISLAINMFKDLSINNFKIELGHAGFFKEITEELNLKPQELHELKRFIEAKNVTGLEPFLSELEVSDHLQDIIKAIPFLYGQPDDVIKRAKKLPLTDKMVDTLDDIATIYDILIHYGVDHYVVIDLGLINHMDYYSDMIFQGFIERVAKPVIMGGRYDQLAKQFNADIPASGFACDIDLLLTGIPNDRLQTIKTLDLTLFYKENERKECLRLANELRQADIRLLTYPINEKTKRKTDSHFIGYKQDELWVLEEDKHIVHTETTDDIVTMIKERK